jgi:hypothetical protein
VEASKRIDKEIAGLKDWRGQILATIRRAIREADPEVTEEWKWMGTAVWRHHGNLCAADAHTHVVKVIFFKGASIPDPDGLFNAELEGTTRRAIKFSEGDAVNEPGLKKLVEVAVELNRAKPAKRPAKKKKKK